MIQSAKICCRLLISQKPSSDSDRRIDSAFFATSERHSRFFPTARKTVSLDNFISDFYAGFRTPFRDGKFTEKYNFLSGREIDEKKDIRERVGGSFSSFTCTARFESCAKQSRSSLYRNSFPRMDFKRTERSFRTAVTVFLCCVPYSYMILAPAAMANEKDPKSGAAKCFEEIALDPDSYRIGHTKAS